MTRLELLSLTIIVLVSGLSFGLMWRQVATTQATPPPLYQQPSRVVPSPPPASSSPSTDSPAAPMPHTAAELPSVVMLQQLAGASQVAAQSSRVITAALPIPTVEFIGLSWAQQQFVVKPLPRFVAARLTMPVVAPTPQWREADKFIFVNQFDQTMYLYEQDTLVRTMPVSTGRPTSVTLTRSWQGNVGYEVGHSAVSHGFTVDYSWYLREGLFGGILIHSLPYTTDGEIKYFDQPDALGVRPASHGCIRISEADAMWLQTWQPVGAKIEITRMPGPIEWVEFE